MLSPASSSSTDSDDSEGQRRHLTLLFADLSDSTRLGELMEAEDYARMLAQLRRLFQQVVARHGGQIARIQGDGVLAFFGYPLPGEDDARRATDAALDLHLAVSQIPVHGDAAELAPLTLHTGIHGGLVYLSGGDLERGRFDLLGNVPNVAARLSALAERDDILVSEETLGPDARHFHTGERVELKVKGRSTPLAIYRVLGRSPQPVTGPRRALSPFVGRLVPLRRLRGHLRRAVSGQPHCVTLQGNPGVGKTRLIEELRRHEAAEQCIFLRGYCESYFSAEPLQPFAQMLRSLQQGGLLEGEALATCRALAEDGVAAFARLADALAQKRPLLLVIDDWQWADDGSRQLLDAVLALPRPIMVLLATRPRQGAEPLERVSTDVIELAPLDEDEQREALQHLLPGADPFVAAQIQRHAGGVPLFLEELCHFATAAGGLPDGPTPGSGAWLNTLVGSRVERLPDAQAELVRAAAVIGNVFPGWLLARVAGVALGAEMLDALAAQDFIYPGEAEGELRFKHGLTREVVYESVGLHRRRELHQRIAQALLDEQGESARDDAHEALAYHCAAGGLHAQAAEHAERAGDRALAVSALDRARDQYAAALEALDALAPLAQAQQRRWCAVAAKLGMACVFDPLGLTHALPIFRRGVEMARASGDPAALVNAEYWLGYNYYAKGLGREAILTCESALSHALEHGLDRPAAQIRATLGQALLASCQYPQALVLLDDALQSKRTKGGRGGSLAVGSAYTLACKGYLLGDRGQFVAARECFDEALDLLGDTVHQVAASVRHWVSVVSLWQGRWGEAQRAAQGAADIARQVKSRQQYAMGQALAGYAQWMQSRGADSLRAIREATRWIEARQGGLATSLNHAWLVEGALAESDLEGARHHAARLFQRVRHADRIGEALGCRALALSAAKGQDFVRAARYLAQAERSAQARGSAHEHAVNLLVQGHIAMQRDQVVAARAMLDQACSALRSMDMRWHLERAQRALGQI